MEGIKKRKFDGLFHLQEDGSVNLEMKIEILGQETLSKWFSIPFFV